MPIDFPNTPTLNQVFTVDETSWKYDGEKWVVSATGITGPAGPSGPTGPSGPSGPSGPTGDWSTAQTLRSITSSTDTPTSADAGRLITVDTTSGSVTITINSSLGLSAGQRIDFAWINAATSVTFSASSVTLNGTPGLKLRTRYSSCSLVCLGSNNYLLLGDLIA